MSDSENGTVEVDKQNKMTLLTLNNPKRKNALTIDMFISLMSSLDACAADPGCVLTVITGTGDFFTSGNDLTNFMNANESTRRKMVGGTADAAADCDLSEPLRIGRDFICRFVKTMIDYPKMLVAIVNGNAVGIGATMLPLFDLVFISNKATISTPFTALGQVPECCSSFTFPLILGPALASSVLLTGRKLTNHEAVRIGLATAMYDPDDMSSFWRGLRAVANSFPPATLMRGKQLLRSHHKDMLHQVNEKECDALLECWLSDEFVDCITAYFSKKSKL